MLKKYWVSLIVVLAILAGCTDKSSKTGAVASDFTLQDMGGKSVKLSDYKGKVVLLEFWASWCPPCRESVPGLEKLNKAYKDKGLVILAVSVDQGGWDDVKLFIKDSGITYTVLKGTDDVAVKYQVRSIPLSLLLDKEGNISKRYLGAVYDEELEKDIKAIL
jgi:thiol-disulfide isomerase/thioredoxin